MEILLIYDSKKSFRLTLSVIYKIKNLVNLIAVTIAKIMMQIMICKRTRGDDDMQVNDSFYICIHA